MTVASSDKAKRPALAVNMALSLAVIASAAFLAGCGDPSAQPESQTAASADGAVADVPSASATHEALAYLSVPDISKRLADGSLTAEALVQASLDRIAALDRQGPTLRSIIALNPNALEQARASDARRAADAALSPIDGMPVLIKDNIETADPMATTAGSTALLTNVTGRDNPAIASLRAAGAVILGKTNLSQWANFRSNDSISGWSAVGGQVKNAHVLDRSPCGSSSGSAVAVAAGLAPLAVGTETNGSIICPSQVNGIVGFKPSLGLVSGQYIVPIAPSQDTAGPMARSVEGAALLLDGLTGSDHNFAGQLGSTSLAGVRIGVLRFAEGSSPHVKRLFNEALAELEATGAELVDIEEFGAPDPEARQLSLSVLEWEFKASLDAYLADSPADIPVRSLTALIDWNQQHADTELALFDQSLFESSAQRSSLNDPAYQHAVGRIKAHAGSAGIDRLLAEYGVSLLVAPSGPVAPAIDVVNGDVWPDWAGAGYLAAIAGYPHLTVPMGTAGGIPLGLSFMGTAGDDAQVLAAGFQWQQVHGPSPTPAFVPSADALPRLKVAIDGWLAR